MLMRSSDGKGHQEGTGTLDPRLAAYTSNQARPSEAIDPDNLNTSLLAEQVGLSFSPGLPLQVGDKGQAIGTGREGTTFGLRLIPIKRVAVYYQLREEEAPVFNEPVKVLI